MPSSTFTFFRQFKENLAKGVHDFTSDSTCTVTCALTAAANAPVNTNEILANLTQISYTNLSSRVVTGITAEHTTGTVAFTANDLVLTASGGSVAAFRYIVLYDDDPTSPADPLIGWFDYGSDLTLADGQTLTIDFGANGFATLA
jgi:hypothetical protein